MVTSENQQRSAILNEFQKAAQGKLEWEKKSQLMQSDRLDWLLKEAKKRVTFYKNQSDVFEQLPLISRNDLIDQPFDYLFDSNQYDKFVVKTSGTLSEPLSVYFDHAGWYRTNYDCFRLFSELAGIEISKIKPGSISILGITNKKERDAGVYILPSMNKSIYSFLSVGNNLQNKVLEETIQRSIGEQIKIFHGKPSCLIELMNLEKKSNKTKKSKLNVKTIFVSGEYLYKDDRKNLSTWYGTKISNVYSSTEGGVIGVECSADENILHVLSDNVLLEIVNDGVLKKQGYGEIVLTNYVNFGTCFLRYQTGDWGELSSHSHCKCGAIGQSLKQFLGKTINNIKLAGKEFKTVSIEEDVLNIGVDDFRLTIADHNHIELKWSASEDIPKTPKEIENQLSTLFKEKYCTEISISNDPDITERGGKKQRFVVL